MSARAAMAHRSVIRAALARSAYEHGDIRINDPALDDSAWLVATQRGLFAVGDAGPRLVLHGWFFGMCRDGNRLYVYENCGYRDRTAWRGRILRFDIAGGRLADPVVLITGLHSNCHQIAVFDAMLHVVDTDNQMILRFALDGTAIDTRRPFPPAPSSDRSGAYLHVNSIARIGSRIGLILHNGKVVPRKRSEIAWLDSDWTLRERHALDGHMCHDIVADGHGHWWHCASEEGAIVRSDGRRVQITEGLMTRGIAIADDRMAVGACAFGPRQTRGDLIGSLTLLDATQHIVRRIEIPSGPADVLALPAR